MPIPYDYQGDWSRMARLIVHQALQTQHGERVILHADPTYFPQLIEQVRIEIVRAGAVELCTGATFGGRQVGTLTYEFRNNRIRSVTAEHHNDFVQALWALETGDNDRFGEFNLGVSPALTLLPEYPNVIPYYGYGAGMVRVSLGDNQEFGGAYRSSYHHWQFLTDATVVADGQLLVDQGRLVFM